MAIENAYYTPEAQGAYELISLSGASSLRKAV